MGVNSLPKTVTRQHGGCDLNPGPTAPESSMLTATEPTQYPRNTIITVRQSLIFYIPILYFTVKDNKNIVKYT